MSTSRTFSPITGGGPAGAYQAGDKLGFQSVEQIRQALDVALYTGGTYPLGGSDDVGILAAVAGPVVGAQAVILDGDALGGLTLDLVVYARTADPATSVTLRLQNLTDSVTVATSTPVTATTLTTETIPITLASGPKEYRLELVGGNADAAVYGYGALRLRKVPA